MSLAEDKENLGFRAKPMPGFQWTDVFDKLGLTYAGTSEEAMVRRLRRLVLAARENILNAEAAGNKLSDSWANMVEASCREHVKAVLTHPRVCTLQPLWLGLSRVQDRCAFLDAFALVFEYLWT